MSTYTVSVGKVVKKCILLLISVHVLKVICTLHITWSCLTKMSLFASLGIQNKCDCGKNEVAVLPV